MGYLCWEYAVFLGLVIASAFFLFMYLKEIIDKKKPAKKTKKKK